MDKKELLIYNIIPTTYRQNSSVIIQEMCNSVVLINQGTTVATINGVVLNPGTPGVNNGESFTFGGNVGEIFMGRIDISFATGMGNILAIQKIYFFNNDY
jgi:hypothetical protein